MTKNKEREKETIDMKDVSMTGIKKCIDRGIKEIESDLYEFEISFDYSEISLCYSIKQFEKQTWSTHVILKVAESLSHVLEEQMPSEWYDAEEKIQTGYQSLLWRFLNAALCEEFSEENCCEM